MHGRFRANIRFRPYTGVDSEKVARTISDGFPSSLVFGVAGWSYSNFLASTVHVFFYAAHGVPENYWQSSLVFWRPQSLWCVGSVLDLAWEIWLPAARALWYVTSFALAIVCPVQT